MTETAQEKRNYKKTLNLPRTSFPMKANLAQNEPASEKRWAKGKLYETIVAAREESGIFLKGDQGLEVLADAASINACKTMDELKNLIRERLEHIPSPSEGEG